MLLEFHPVGLWSGHSKHHALPCTSRMSNTKHYVPQCLRARLNTWAYTALATGHPGTRRTWEIIKDKYSWPTMTENINNFVFSCAMCVQAKVSRHLLAGKFSPLPTPNRSWSHIAIDFLTDLPKSEGMTTSLVILDRFSQAIKLFPLPNLPSAFQTAELL